jgi:uncharacterized SAM-binding protein YcdF (DUF218 family)
VFFLLSKSLDLAVSPIVWVVVLVACALFMVARRSPNRRRLVGCLVGAIAVLLVLGNPSIADRIFQSLEDDAPNTYDATKTYDAVVLLGGLVPGGVTDPARPSYDNGVERLLVTYDLLRTDRAKHVIIASGSNLEDATFVKESSALRTQLERWGIAKERILVDDVSLNTRQNAVETARIVKERGFTRLLLVTSAFHMTRAAGCFRAVDLQFDTLPADYRVLPARIRTTDFAPRTGALHESGEAFRELLGRGVYRALGYTK